MPVDLLRVSSIFELFEALLGRGIGRAWQGRVEQHSSSEGWSSLAIKDLANVESSPCDASLRISKVNLEQ